MLKELACTVAAVAALPLSAQAAAVDYFLKIDSVKGESFDAKHKDWIDVLSWSWGVSSTGTAGGGSGGGAGRVNFEPFSWEQELDSSFVPLFLGLVQGKHFKQAQLDVVRAGKDPTPFFQIILDDVLVTKLSSSGDSDTIMVDSSMVFNKMTLRYRKQKADGSYEAAVEGAFDLKKGSAAFAGDPTVLMGMAEAGGTLNFISGVPEPATWASFGAGLAVVAALVRRRRPEARPGGRAVRSENAAPG